MWVARITKLQAQRENLKRRGEYVYASNYTGKFAVKSNKAQQCKTKANNKIRVHIHGKENDSSSDIYDIKIFLKRGYHMCPSIHVYTDKIVVTIVQTIYGLLLFE